LPLFGRRPAAPSPEEAQAAAVDLERIAGGGIPLGAEQRLTRVASAKTPLFSSDLSSKEYAVGQVSGLSPVAQVMGSSVVQVGWRNYGGWGYMSGVADMPAFAEPWNLSRERSFGRLRQEATFAGADAVLGIEMTTKPFLDEPGNIELAVFGTAVRDTGVKRGERTEPRLCTLSGQDVYKLRRIGAETLDVIGHTSVVCAALSPWANQQMSSWWGNQEMTEVTQGVYAARRLAMQEVLRQAAAAGANEMVITDLQHTIHHQEFETTSYRSHIFIVSMHVLGTAIALGAHEPHPEPLGLPMISINLGA
jgi:uncharacterized protein YbjQ (UPF0145 family)